MNMSPSSWLAEIICCCGDHDADVLIVVSSNGVNCLGVRDQSWQIDLWTQDNISIVCLSVWCVSDIKCFNVCTVQYLSINHIISLWRWGKNKCYKRTDISRLYLRNSLKSKFSWNYFVCPSLILGSPNKKVCKGEGRKWVKSNFLTELFFCLEIIWAKFV